MTPGFLRDSVEARPRFLHGSKPANEMGELRQTPLSITLGGDSDWNGCRVEPVEEDGEVVVVVELVPQVRITGRGHGWIFVRGDAPTDTAIPSTVDITSIFRGGGSADLLWALDLANLCPPTVNARSTRPQAIVLRMPCLLSHHPRALGGGRRGAGEQAAEWRG
jgi:hypothetical protein